MSQRGEQTQAHIIRTAAKLFAEKGYHDTTHHDISQAAEVNIAAVNYHFGGIEGLYAEVWRHLAEQRESREHQTPPTLDAEAYICEHIRQWLLAISDDGEDGYINSITHFEIRQPTPRHDEIMAQYIEPRRHRLRTSVAEILGVQSLDENIVHIGVHMIVSPIIAIMHHRRHAECKSRGGRPSKKSELFPDKHEFKKPGPPQAITHPDSWDLMIDSMQNYALAGLKALAQTYNKT